MSDIKCIEHLAVMRGTGAADSQTPDSAPTAGALNAGVKQCFKMINTGESGIHEDCATVPGNELTTFAEIVSVRDKSVGVVSTARITSCRFGQDRMPGLGRQRAGRLHDASGYRGGCC